MDDLVLREGILYKKFSDVPFSGKVTGSYKGLIKNGKKEGSWSYFYGNGQLAGKGNWKKGKKEGSWSYFYGNGQLMRKGNWKKGKQEGAWVEYEKDGSLDKKQSGMFRNGVKVSD